VDVDLVLVDGHVLGAVLSHGLGTDSLVLVELVLEDDHWELRVATIEVIVEEPNGIPGSNINHYRCLIPVFWLHLQKRLRLVLHVVRT
jgi:hypothetical protein